MTIFDLNGRMTADEGFGDLRNRVKGAVRGGKAKVLLNFEKVSYLDSAAVGQIVSAYISAGRAGGVLKLLRPSERVVELFGLAKLTSIFETYDAERDAVSSFSKPPAKTLRPRW